MSSKSDLRNQAVIRVACLLGWVGLGLLFTGCSGQSPDQASAGETNGVEMVSVTASNGEEAAVSAGESEAAEPAGAPSTEPAADTAPAEEAPQAPAVSEAEVAALKADLDKSRQVESNMLAEMQALKGQISGLETNLAAAQAETQKAVADLKTLQTERDQLKAENLRLQQLDYNEYARLIELSISAPNEALSQWPVFLEKFPLSPLNKEAREQMKRVERRIVEDRAMDRAVQGDAIYTDRVPLGR